MDIRVGSLISVRDYKVGQFWCKVSSCDGDVWPHHLCRIDHTVELFFADEAELEGGGLEREIAVHRMMRDLGRLVVADDRRECRHQHQRTLYIFGDLLPIGPRVFDEEPAEVRAAVGEQRN